MHIPGSSHGISLHVYLEITFLVPQMYTNIQSHQHKITQITWNHMVDNFNKQTFDIWTG